MKFPTEKKCAILKWIICVFLILVTYMIQNIVLSSKVNSILQKLPLNLFSNCDLENCELEKEELFILFSELKLYADKNPKIMAPSANSSGLPLACGFVGHTIVYASTLKKPKQKSESVSSATTSVSVTMDVDLQITESKPNTLGLKSFFDFFNIF